MTAFEPWARQRAEEIIAAHLDRDGAALPILHALQAAFGHVPRDAAPLMAKALNISRAEAHGVMSFYHDFRPAPPGRRALRICRAESCQAVGGEAAANFLLAALGIGWGETTADGEVSVDAAYCLGLCAVSPAALVDDEPLGRVDGLTLLDAARR